MEYDEDPEYGKLIQMFVDELLRMDVAPQVANYDWVKNPKFLTHGCKLQEPFMNKLISMESREMSEIEERVENHLLLNLAQYQK